MSGITQKDIARRMGVSRQAVAFALSDSPEYHSKLREETRRRIREMAELMEYVPHRHAQLMRVKRSGVIGMIKNANSVQTAVERSFFASKAIYEAGFGLLANEILWSAEGLKRAVGEMLAARVEAVLLDGIWDESASAHLQRLRDANIPIVSLAGARRPSIPLVVSDFRQGMFELTQHLLNLGYRKLTLVSALSAESETHGQSYVLRERLEGFRDATERAGLGDKEAKVVWHPMPSGSFDGYEPGRIAARQVLDSKDRPEVLLCSNDEYAVGAIGMLAESGLRVPEDVAITGFDNTTMGRYLFPPLTTIAHPTEALAKRAVALLLEQMAGKSVPTSEEVVRLPCQLVVRHSCGSRFRKPS